jgi:HEAT repeat protein
LEIREQCLDYLMSFERPVSILPYVQALKDKDNVIVNHAGAALGKLGNPAAISPMIDALVTTHKYQVHAAPPGQIGAAFDPRGGGGGLQMGGNGPQIVERDRENLSVLRALEKLTANHEFDFDEQAWRRWYVDRQMREHVNSRRDE